MNSNKIIGLPDSPSADNDATSKKYVDGRFINASIINNLNVSGVTTLTSTLGYSGTALTTTGRIGVNKSTPRMTLDVEGDIRATQSIYADSGVYFGATYTETTNNINAAISYSDYNDKSLSISSGGANSRIYFTTGFNNRMTITGAGLVGIGTTTPTYPLDIAKSIGYTMSSAGWYAKASGSGTYGGAGDVTNISLKTIGDIWISTGSWLWITSDQRIKKNIVNLNADKMMNIIRTLRPISFDFIDPTKNNNKKHFGFIAQEINEVIPEGITLNTDVIPNNMMKGEIDQKSKIEASFTLKPDDTDISLNYLLLKTDTSVKFDTANPYSSTNVYKFKVYCGEKWAKEQDIYISSNYNVIDDKYTYVIGMKKDVYDIVITEPTLFVYGQYVFDLHILDHDTIYTVATAALQEVDRQQQADKARIAELEATVSTQQSLINDILERLKTLERA